MSAGYRMYGYNFVPTYYHVMYHAIVRVLWCTSNSTAAIITPSSPTLVHRVLQCAPCAAVNSNQLSYYNTFTGHPGAKTTTKMMIIIPNNNSHEKKTKNTLCLNKSRRMVGHGKPKKIVHNVHNISACSSTCSIRDLVENKNLFDHRVSYYKFLSNMIIRYNVT